MVNNGEEFLELLGKIYFHENLSYNMKPLNGVNHGTA
jgi:hypothetical protein